MSVLPVDILVSKRLHKLVLMSHGYTRVCKERGWINFEFEFEFEFELTRVRASSASTVRTVKNNLASQIRIVYVVVRFDFRGWTAKGCRCAHRGTANPLLTA